MEAKRKTNTVYTECTVKLDNKNLKHEDGLLIVPAVVTAEGVHNRSWKKGDAIVNALPYFNGLNVTDSHPPRFNNDPAAPWDYGVPDVFGYSRNDKIEEQDDGRPGIWLEMALFEDTQVAKEVENGERDSISIGFMALMVDESGVFNGEDYDTIEVAIVPDHIAILKPNEKPACTPEHGCGIRAGNSHSKAPPSPFLFKAAMADCIDGPGTPQAWLCDKEGQLRICLDIPADNAEGWRWYEWEKEEVIVDLEEMGYNPVLLEEDGDFFAYPLSDKTFEKERTGWWGAKEEPEDWSPWERPVMITYGYADGEWEATKYSYFKGGTDAADNTNELKQQPVAVRAVAKLDRGQPPKTPIDNPGGDTIGDNKEKGDTPPKDDKDQDGKALDELRTKNTTLGAEVESLTNERDELKVANEKLANELVDLLREKLLSANGELKPENVEKMELDNLREELEKAERVVVINELVELTKKPADTFANEELSSLKKMLRLIAPAENTKTDPAAEPKGQNGKKGNFGLRGGNNTSENGERDYGLGIGKPQPYSSE